MILYPAVDIFNGKCVRLRQGDFAESTVYFENPLDAARKWAGLGASSLHVVDLNGALEGRPVNLKPIEEILTSVNLPIQIGGGIRDEATAEIFLTMGAGRVVIGSAAVEDPDIVQVLSVKYEDRIAVGIDARDGKVAIHGWKEIVDKEAIEVAQEFEGMGLRSIIYTDISRDGMLSGPNFEAIQKMISSVGIPIVVSGGVSTLEDLKRLKELGAGGVILGRSLYENRIDFKEALTLC